MELFTIFALITALLTTAVTIVVGIALSATRRELERVQRRMERLDAVVDDVALREFEASEKSSTSADFETGRPFQGAPLRESGTFQPIGLELDTDAELDAEFAAPRMTAEVNGTPPRQIPSRERHETPVGSPRNLTPRSRDALVAVGSIEIRSDDVGSESRE